MQEKYISDKIILMKGKMKKYLGSFFLVLLGLIIGALLVLIFNSYIASDNSVINISADQFIAWSLTIISITLFIVEKFKNSKKPVYMALQGLMKSIYVKFQYHNAHFGLLAQDNTSENERVITIHEYMTYTHGVASDMDSLIEQTLGIIKSLDIGKDVVFDKEYFTQHNASMKAFEAKMQSTKEENNA